MRILHVVAGLPPGGGISESVPSLCRHLRQCGHEVTLATLDGPLSGAARLAEANGVRLVRFKPVGPGRLFFSWELVQRLANLVNEADVIHVHSNWTTPVWWACHCAAKAKKPFVMSPRGCLAAERLRRSAWKKRMSGWLFDRRYLTRASVLHATCQTEAESIVQYLLGSRSPVCEETRIPPVVVIPNGINKEAFVEQHDRRAIEWKWDACKGKHVLLFMSRIHPLKGLDLLVSAWERVAIDFPNWHLLVAGPDEQGHEKEMRRAVQRSDLLSRVTFCGPLYGEERSKVMMAADLFVLPTRNENFGIVVAEALYCGVPVVTTKGAPWLELLGNSESSKVLKFENLDVERETAGQAEDNNSKNLECSKFITAPGRCGWWVDIGAAPLAMALKEAMSLTDAERCAMGDNGRRLVEAKYQWPKIAKEMQKVYEECVRSSKV